MEDYNFWQDLFDTYQSLPDWMKFAWLIIPPSFLLGLIAMVMRYRLTSKHASEVIEGELLYSVRSEAENELRVYRHDHEHFPKDTVVPLPIIQREKRLTFEND
ncbi:hypothetical protein [Lentilitoribacter sp. EG35]|uniref:hypothetical protein n=1 Tax=Lentilitoribacter sp. EG35 TaxID=3234192 RepID=UPI00345FCA9A